MRARRGKLQRMMNMPLDIWLEILAYLAPGDIFHLACASRELRDSLTNPNLLSVWINPRNAESPPVPQPMIGYSEAAWIGLLFDPHCDFCPDKNVRTIDFTFRTRLCSDCRKTQYVSPNGEIQN
ncbi:uncharacterized protein EV420DRAFT_1089955 [Desarmillaria tabescens]|uniref:F-box domain-containing protein n=1 Tax=Armillaria tabescens TaxID=1929756 RepID=A0AA39ND85_ARMTA|nr:uncharacterized protein EV420DRAFT_1089955 [Desarmillaria tabescens]KAK0463464.1 hypothetical protein EV420DRAFT_1089955 [Desarmillaria tabescens]